MAGKGKKIIGGILVFVFFLVVVLLCIFFFWLGPTVKMVAEHFGSKALGTPLTINELKINPHHGTFHMTGFAIGNPDEFGQTNAVSLAGMDIALDIGSIFSRTVVVHRVQIDSPYFIYEQNEASDNVTEFMENLEEYLGGDTEKPEPKKPDEDDIKEPKVVIVEQLEVNDIQFHLAHTDATNMDINIGIEQVAVSMTNGIATLKNLHVSNPSLLETPNLFILDGIEIEVDPASIYSDRMSIRDVQVIRPYAYLEKNPQTDTVTEFMKIANRFANAATNAPAAMEPVVEETDSIPPPIDLHNLLVDDIRIKLLDCTASNAPAKPRTLAGIEAISVKLVAGRIQIQGISVPNVEGYTASNLFHLANIDMSIDPASIYSGQINIQKILVESPEINLEQTETSGNVADLQTQLMDFVPPEGAETGAPTQEPAPQTGEGPEPTPLSEQPVVLHSLVVTNFAINLTLPAVTNEPAAWALDISELQKLNPMEDLSLGKLNPLAKMKIVATNQTEAAKERMEGGPLKLLAFRQLTLTPLEGRLQIDNLSVGNPPGYANPNLIKLDCFKLDVDPDTLQSDVLLIRDVLIDTPRIAYERRVTTDNLKAMQLEIERATGKTEETTDAESTAIENQTNEKNNEGQKVIIDHLLVKDGLAKAKLSIAPSLPIPLPDIEMSDIGKDKGGTSFAGALSEIGTTIYDILIGAVSGTTGFAGDALKGFGALTLGTPDDSMKGEDHPDGQMEQEEEQLETTVSPPEATHEKPRKRRSPFHHRRPGRVF